MRLFSARRFAFVLLLLAALPAARADHWIAPTAEELKMTSQPEVPGAAAVYLYREETTEDSLHAFTTYVRLKVLTEAGRDEANVELPYVSDMEAGSVNITDIAGRTIHPDGTIIPFTGKPYQKLIVKRGSAKRMAKVFTLPDVQVGSIIEYRYIRRLDDHWFSAPQWYVQSNMFTRRAHYQWKPTTRQLVTNDDRGQLTSTVSWTPILPVGSQVKQVTLPAVGVNESQTVITLDIENIPPAPDEEYMPPTASFSYRVLFYYSPYHSAEEFWKNEGKHWSKLQDKFIGPGSGVSAAVAQLTTPSDTPDQKLRKIYAAIMRLENTDFTREHSNAEEKSQGLRQVRNTDDVWTRQRGSCDQLAGLFVAMARAAGMQAYLMAVTSRDKNVFYQQYLSLSQLNDLITIVRIDGKDQFFDPGSRYCPYGQLAWKHTLSGGMRQSDKGSELVTSPTEDYKASRIERVANLTMDEHGVVSGTVKLTYSGAPALAWRHSSLTGDSTSLKHDLQSTLEHMLPSGMDINVTNIQKLDEYELPLIVEFDVKGPIGTATGKRLLVPGDLFEANSKATFPQEKRKTGVYFSYPRITRDAIRIHFPPAFSVESLPTSEEKRFQSFAIYQLKAESAPTSFTVRRDFLLGNIIYLPNEYPDLRTFYNQFETKDQESVVLKVAGSAPEKSAATIN